MKGFQVTFYTQQDRRHHHTPMAEWLLLTARDLGVRGATVVAASEGFGQHRRIHSAHFFDLADQPLEVVLAVTEEECDRLFGHLRTEGVHLFYVKAPVEFGMLGTPDT